jgi:hypothetical protein
MTTPNKMLNASASDGSPGGGESTATWKPSRLVSYPDGRRFTLLGGAALHVALASVFHRDWRHAGREMP